MLTSPWDADLLSYAAQIAPLVGITSLCQFFRCVYFYFAFMH